MLYCPVCYEETAKSDFESLATHFLSDSLKNDGKHVSWLNRNISKLKLNNDELSKQLMNFYHVGNDGIKMWIIRDFIQLFRGLNPHPFILGMQEYDVPLLKGYVVEHHHFLKQWIRSCSYAMAKTDLTEVHDYEIENIVTEMHGYGSNAPSHHELLIRMGESLGLERKEILDSKPLKGTQEAIKIWQKIASEKSTMEIMSAMHSLELIANRDLQRYGAKYPYFNPEMLKSPAVSDEVKNFLREGYEADVSHSYQALSIIQEHCNPDNILDIQSAYLVSSRAFFTFLESRIERGEMYKNQQ